MNPEVRAAVITARVAIICVALTAVAQGVFYFFAVRDKRQEELMQHRREALISALEVVDHVYSNVSMAGKPPSNPHEWDSSLARNAMNGIIIYCDDPNRALAAFSRATGLYNPDTQAPGSYGPKDLEEFRNVICDELGVSPIRYANSNVVWIYKMPGAK